MEALSLTPAAWTEPWRLCTGHLVHWGAGHLVWNACAAAVPLFFVRARGEALGVALAVAPLLSLVILTLASPGEYRGASGVIVALWAWTAVILFAEKRLAAGLTVTVLLAAKLASEQAGVTLASGPFEPLPLAHQAGAVLGLVVDIASLRRVAPPPATNGAAASRPHPAPAPARERRMPTAIRPPRRAAGSARSMPS